MNYGKRIALPRSSVVTDSDSAIGDDYEDDGRGHKRSSSKDKMNRNLSEKKRRDQFNMLVNELCSMVSTNSKKMDKSTVLKSTIAFLKNYQETTTQAQVHEIKENWKPSFLTNDEFMHLMLEALDSFLLMFTQQGTILYASESVTSLLGHLPADMVNKSIYDFVCNSEASTLHNVLNNYSVSTENGVPEYEKVENQLCFDCNVRRGSTDPRDSPVYEGVTIRGSFRHWNGETPLFDDKDGLQGFGTSMCSLGNTEQVCFFSTVRLRKSQLVREMSIVDDNKEFTSRHSLEWKFLFLDHRAPPIIGYLPFEVLGTSGYDYYHPDDLDNVSKSHEQLMTTGEGTSCYYRFLTKGQQWIWLKTRYFITYHQWNSKPEFIHCTNTVVSYSDVRSHRRKELGYNEDVQPKQEGEVHRGRRSSRSPSVGSVTSGGKLESTWSSSPPYDTPDRKPGTAISDKDSRDSSNYPTSTSTPVRSRAVSEQLHQFLQRHIEQQSQQQQQQQLQVQTTTASFSSIQLQQLLQRRQLPSQHSAGTRHQRILPRPSSTTTSLEPSHSRMLQRPPVSTPPQNIYMSPVQKKLHDQLQQKARQVQDAIMRQQEELRTITEQLSFAKQGTVPMVGPPSDMRPGVISNQMPMLGEPSLQMENQPVVPMVSMATHNPIMMDQSSFLPFPVMPHDAEIMMSHTDTPESPHPSSSHQQ